VVESHKFVLCCVFVCVCMVQAEELIKQEMVSMLRHDLIHHSTGKIPKSVMSKVKADHNADYQTLEEEERDTASEKTSKLGEPS